jgi:hypothetical protein
LKINRYWWLFLIACPQLLIAGNRFIVPAGTSVSDIMVTHYPNLLFIQRSLYDGQGIPLWSPMILGGYPFEANPLSTLWYPPAWLTLFFPLPLGINLVMALHLITGCAGMAFLLDTLKLKKPLILLGAVVFGLLPAGFARIAGGHFTWVCASAWMPWLLALSYAQNLTRKKRTIFSAVAIGLMMLADLRFAIYGIIIWSLLNFSLEILENQDKSISKLKNLGFAGFSLLLAFGISAIVWLPLSEYSTLSSRSLLTTKDTFYLSLPILQTLGFLIPGHPWTFEWVIYLGTGLFIPCLYSFTSLKKERRLIFWWLTVIFCLLWSLGDAIPVNQMLAGLPGINLLRVPARAEYFLGVSILIISLIALNDFLGEKKKHLKFFRLGVLGILVFTAMGQIGTYFANPESNFLLLFHAFFTITISITFLVNTYGRIQDSVFTAIFAILFICDFSMANWGLVGYRSLQEALSVGGFEAEYLATKGKDFRIFSPSYSIPQQTAAYSRLELVDGIDPLQLSSYVDYVNHAANLLTNQYSVTLPAFDTGNIEIDNSNIKPDAEAFGLLNTRYMVSAFPVEEEGWELEKSTDKSFIYRNNLVRGWAWIENNGQVRNSSIPRITRANNEITVEAEGPGLLVISEVNYPGWEATVDGNHEIIKNAHSILRSVELSSGRHIIRFKFVPNFLYAGTGISMLSIIISFILLKKVNFQ